MIAAATVTVVVGGRIVEGSTPAVIRGNVVVAPVWPYLDGIAQRVQSDGADNSITFERAGRTFRVAIGSPFARSGAAAQSLSIAPYLRAGEAIIPLAAVARGLGASVAYDAATRTLAIDLQPAPLATMRPYAAWSPFPGPRATFEPTATPEPHPSVTGIPLPRRTPILVERGR